MFWFLKPNKPLSLLFHRNVYQRNLFICLSGSAGQPQRFTWVFLYFIKQTGVREVSCGHWTSLLMISLDLQNTGGMGMERMGEFMCSQNNTSKGTKI